MSTPTRTRKLILSPTSIRKRVTTTTTTTSTTNGGGNLNNRFRENEDEFYKLQQQELRNLHDQQLHELQELQVQQINEIEELTKHRTNARLKSIYKFLITILVASIIYGVYTNQFQPTPVEPFHSTEPIGHQWLESIKDKSWSLYQLWGDNFKDLARIRPLSPSETLPAGHNTHHHHHIHESLRDTKKIAEDEMERLRRLDIERVIRERNNFRNHPNIIDDSKILKEIERQLKPNEAALKTNSIPSIATNTIHDIEQSPIVESIENKVDDAISILEEKSKQLLSNIQDKKEQIKESITNFGKHEKQNLLESDLKKEFDQLIKDIERANYNIFKDLKDNIGEPTIEKLNELKYKFKDAARETRESFKQKIESAQAIEQDLINLQNPNYKQTTSGRTNIHQSSQPQPHPHRHFLNQENQPLIDENLIIV